MFQFNKLIRGMAVMVGGLITSQSSHAWYVGETLATFDFNASRLLMNPSTGIMYASALNQNSVVGIDTETLKIVSNTFVGSRPDGLALSNDGSKLYVAVSGSNFIGVIDTQSNQLINSINVQSNPTDVEVGLDGRLYVLTSSAISVRDPVTGANIGSQLPIRPYSGEMTMSPDKSTLYYADYGLSPASLYKIDVSGVAPSVLWESPHGGTSGSNGQDLAISHDGSFVSYATGSGQIGYSIAKYRTSDMAIEGTFNTGAYPREITFSPDDAVAYTVNQPGLINHWDTQTFRSLGPFAVNGEVFELEVDATGRYLFASMAGGASTGRLLVLNTGRMAVPEPGTLWLFALGLFGLLLTGQRRKLALTTADKNVRMA